MRGNSDSIRRLKAEMAALSKEIDYRIDRLEQLPDEIDDNCKSLRTFVDDWQDSLNVRFRKAYMTKGEEAWDFCWESIWDMVKDFQLRADARHNHSYPELVPVLKSRQTALGRTLKLNALWADQVWNEVWAAVWQVVQQMGDRYRREALAEFERCEQELDPLLEHKATLRKELEGLQHSGNGMYQVLKNTFNTGSRDKHH